MFATVRFFPGWIVALLSAIIYARGFALDTQPHFLCRTYGGLGVVWDTGGALLRPPEDEAIARFKSWNQSQPFAPLRLKQTSLDAISAVHEKYLPFYAFDTTVRTMYEGERGEMVFRPNSDRRASVVIDYLFTRVSGACEPEQYSADLPEMQIYGSYTYHKDFVEVIKYPLAGAKRFSALPPSMVAGKEFDPFKMFDTTARHRMIDKLMELETQRCEQLIRQTTGADVVRNVNVQCSIEYECRDLYLPAYVIEYSYTGREWRVLINGYSGEIFGEQQYSGLTVFGATLVPWSVACLWMAGHHGWHPFLAFAMLVPPTLTGLAAQLYPYLNHFMRERQRQLEEQRDQDEKEYSEKYEEETEWEEESEKRYKRTYEQRARAEQEQKSQHKKQQERQQARSESEKDHYALLAIPRNASLEQIQAGFRKQVFQWHPDLKREPKEKELANKKFKEILQAYQVLRDPKKRAEYDATL